MNRRFALDLTSLALVAAGWTVLALGSAPSAVLAPLAVAGLIVVPGYCLSLGLLPRGTLSPAERTMYALAFSVSVDILAGLILNLTPSGITLRGWAIVVGAITLASCAFAMMRGAALWPPSLHDERQLRATPLLLSAVAATVAVGALAVAVVGAHRDERRATFIRLAVMPAGRGFVSVTAQQEGSRPQRYDVRVSGHGSSFTWALALIPGQEWISPKVAVTTGDVLKVRLLGPRVRGLTYPAVDYSPPASGP